MGPRRVLVRLRTSGKWGACIVEQTPDFVGAFDMVRVPECGEAVRRTVARRAFLLAQLARRFRRLVAAAWGIESVVPLGYQLALGVLCLLLAIAPACAQVPVLTGRSGLDALYQRVLRDPKNIRFTLQ
jgi:hypothetical protein